METVIVALVVGAFGGLAGTIVGPFLGHKLDRGRRRELRQEERNRELRRMLEVSMRLAGTVHASGLMIQLAVIKELDLEQVAANGRAHVLELDARYPDDFWRPYRIQDATLQNLAINLSSARIDLTWLIDQRPGLPMSQSGEWSERIEQQVTNVDAGIEAIDRRMDELDW